MKRRMPAASVGLLCVAAIVALMVVSIDRGSDGGPLRTLQGAAVATPVQQGLNDIGPVPFPIQPQTVVSAGSSVVAIGTEIVDGKRQNEAVEYEPSSGVWTELPSIPAEQPLAGVDAAWNGNDLVALGVLCEVPDDDASENLPCAPGELWAGAYNPAQRTWTKLDPPVTTPRAGAEGGFGRAIGRLDNTVVFNVGDALWSFNGSRWSTLPTAPQPNDFSCIAGDALVVGGGIEDASASKGTDGIVDTAGAQFQRFDPATNAWTALPTLTTHQDFPNVYAFACSADSVLAATWRLDESYALNVGGGDWSVEPSVPDGMANEPFVGGAERPAGLPAQTSAVNFAWTGRAFVWWNPRRTISEPINGNAQSATFPGNGLVFEPTAKAWRRTDPGPAVYGSADSKLVAWADGVGYAFGATDGQSHLFAYSP